MKGYSHLTIGCIMSSLAWGQPCRAHLCNDVFAQAQDNLAVKVDIRDGQLRIGESASFRVYLLNTMDRAIAAINLAVLAPQFDSTVEPDPEWNGYPALKAVKEGGRKQYFTVSLKRKPGIPDGKYKIDLCLLNPRNTGQEFKTLDLGSASASHAIKPASGITVNGDPTPAEWQNAVLCTDFYTYRHKGQYFTNERADNQSRVRVALDKDNLLCLLGFEGQDDAEQDVATLYVAATPDDAANTVRIDRVQGKAVSNGHEAVVVKKSADGKQLECSIPRSLLGIDKSASFYLNLTRTTRKAGKESVSFWRGNTMSAENPVVYDRFVIN